MGTEEAAGCFQNVDLDLTFDGDIAPLILGFGSALTELHRREDFAVFELRGVQAGRPVLEDGRTLDVQNVIWTTGFHPGFSWVHLPVFDEEGYPCQYRGLTSSPGLYFIGLHFLYAMSSAMIHGVGRDARHVAETIAGRLATEPATGMASAA